MRRVQSAPRALPASGYRLNLGGELVADLHADGALSVEGPAGAADFTPSQVEALAVLLALGAGQRAAARRRRARAAYAERWASDEER